jgi:DNA (cytosine-5)-methyltransferase 1
MSLSSRDKTMTAVGITCGIGSMLVGARQAGFKVLGNIEWRKYYHRRDEMGHNTFLSNFDGALMRESVNNLSAEEIVRMTGADVAYGHPECGHYSMLNKVNKHHKENAEDPGDIPLFVDLVARLRPRFFVMDDLPDSFKAFPMAEYTARLGDYDLFPEWISNYHYGNIQKNRRRMFMIGSLKSERWTFRPDEHEHQRTLRDVLGDLPDPRIGGNFPNQDVHTLTTESAKGRHLDTLGRDGRPTFAQLRDWFLSNPEGTTLRYISEDGTVKTRPSHAMPYWEGHAHVIDGGSPHIHPKRGTPFTIRERARIQGFPDDFVFYGTKLATDGTYNHEQNMEVVKQTGKAMPIQFCAYVGRQIMAHLRGDPFECGGQRLIQPHAMVDSAKQWYCQNVGYTDQLSACSACWLRRGCKIRTEKYSIGVVEIKALLSEIEDPLPPPASSPVQVPRKVVAAGKRKVVGRQQSPEPAAARKNKRFAALAPGEYTDINFGGK